MNVLREAIYEIRTLGFRRWWTREIIRTRESGAKSMEGWTEDDLIW